MSAQMLEVSLLGVGTAARLERNACVVNGQITTASNKRVRPPAPPPNPASLFPRLCEVNNIFPAQVGMVVSRSVYGKAPKRQLRSTPIAVSGSVCTGN